MSRYRRGSIALLMLAALVGPDAGRAEPFVPDSDALVLERVPAAGDDLTRQLRDRRAALARDPDDLELALSLAADSSETVALALRNALDTAEALGARLP